MLETIQFAHRREAGSLLAQHLMKYKNRPDATVLALLRGGVPVGDEVAKTLGLPLDVLTVRKIGCPMQPELALGAVSSDGVCVLNKEILHDLQMDEESLAQAITSACRDLARRDLTYRGQRPAADIRGRAVILVDDGLATGATMKAAVKVVRARGAREIVVAVPVAPKVIAQEFSADVDRFCCLAEPSPFYSVGSHYMSFDQVTDDEVKQILSQPTASRRYDTDQRADSVVM